MSTLDSGRSTAAAQPSERFPSATEKETSEGKSEMNLQSVWRPSPV